MNVQTLCLAALSLGEASGYEIKKVFEDGFSHFIVAGFGSIYPALGQLEGQGLVSHIDVAQTGRPAKKVYRITEEGRRVLSEQLAAAYPHHKVRSEFLVQMLFCHLLPPQRLNEVFEQRLGDIEQELVHIAQCQSEYTTPGAQFTLGYAQAVYEAARDYIENNREALQRSCSADTSNKERE